MGSFPGKKKVAQVVQNTAEQAVEEHKDKAMEVGQAAMSGDKDAAKDIVKEVGQDVAQDAAGNIKDAVM
eukprot:CAMPEP_0179302378 /NCGR_PEP_ID=MMETSP0797-20121207/48035_1 /TAXON_ID=47934 /ORGANISM="Dinophysis acuminata, Strain DAEP01" /LENGTH=68 /DNA_ID=CAMNT_0021011909 /DNA_START=81 /DNA_END=287 /DNA_ORIENTATION=+